MDGRNRRSIFPGLTVAIVLKEDQESGKRSYGEVAQILTSSEFHPRGIKVRLKDGRVGRVQEILRKLPDPSPKAASASTAPAGLLVLLIQNHNGELYARRLAGGPGESITALGLDGDLRAGMTEESLLQKMAVNVPDCEDLHALGTLNLRLGDASVTLHGYCCRGSIVIDEQAHLWSWTGWLPASEVDLLSQRQLLSGESAALYQRLHAEGEGRPGE